MTEKYLVRWNPSKPEQVTFWSPLGQPVTGDIPAKAPNDYEFTTDDANSDLGVQGFILRIAPTSPDIKVGNGSGTTIRFSNAHSTTGVRLQLNMSVAKSQHGYTIDGGKPVIRNDPQTIFNPRVVLYVAIALALVVLIAYWMFLH